MSRRRSSAPCVAYQCRLPHRRGARTSISPRFVLGGIAALIAGGLVFAMEIWTVVPAPTLSTLAPAVVVPEVGPWAVGCCIAAAAIAHFAARGWTRTLGTACSAAAFGLALVPWCLLPATIQAADTEMRAGIGAGGSDSAPQQARALVQPYDLAIALRGYRKNVAVRVLRDLPVPSSAGPQLALDLYSPATAGPHPAVVVIYGGAWIFGSRAQSAELAQSLAQIGYTAIAIDYRHAPQYRFPDQIDDVRAALTTIAVHAHQWDIDPGRVAIFGRSAGAELALLAAYTPGPLKIRAAIGYYAPTDLVRGYAWPPVPDPAGVDRILRAYLGGSPHERPAGYVAASPVSRVRSGLPPTLLICGGRDELVRLAFQTELRDLLRRRGNRVVALSIPWSNHAFDTVPNGTAGQLARYYSQHFLAATL